VRISDAIDRYLAAAGVSEATKRAYATDLQDFAAWYGPHPLDSVDVRVLADYASELGAARRGGKLSPATIARRLSAVRSLLRFALGPAQVPDVPLAPRRGRRLPDAPKQAEVEGLIEGAGEGGGLLPLRNRALLELAYSAGLRSAEVVALDLGDVDFEQEHVHVRSGKGAKDRIVPLGDTAAARARRAERALPVRARPAPRHLDAATRAAQPTPPAPRLRNAPARGWSRPARDPGAARTRLPLDDTDLQPRRR